MFSNGHASRVMLPILKKSPSDVKYIRFVEDFSEIIFTFVGETNEKNVSKGRFLFQGYGHTFFGFIKPFVRRVTL